MGSNKSCQRAHRRRIQMDRRLWVVLIVLFSLIFAVSSFMLIKNLVQRQMAIQYYDDLRISYEPEFPTPQTKAPKETKSPDESSTDTLVPDDTQDTEPQETVRPGVVPNKNPTLLELNEQYPDVIGWIRVPNTRISYPIVQSADNDYYLRRDLNGDYLISGTVFMDFRCDPDFGMFKTILYGHFMKNGTMFADIDLYSDPEFLEDNPHIYIATPEFTMRYTVYAYLVVRSTDPMIYSFPDEETEDTNAELLAYIQKNARTINADLTTDENSNFLILSTCSDEYEDARMILVAVAG